MGEVQRIVVVVEDKEAARTAIYISIPVDDSLISVRNFMHDFSLRHRRFCY
ncbi:hypothetical protein F2Q68_00043377 [Brassica cretica]|uniref:Uncharacterized protein n=1 Tax=Brassica cretica TaxID=69181 RepID=A0A8S9LJK5_BRACR|nr:hypothetical protein F2Q68_00043377 [Brassica cretica]